MSERWMSRRGRLAIGALVLLLIAIVIGGWPDAEVHAQDPDLERVQAENACYVRLPDLPDGRYAGFGGYNPQTGVMTYAGGAQKISTWNTITFHNLWAIELDGAMDSWNEINYSGNVGYTREQDHGCREMASVEAGTGVWASVLGTDGCDNGAIDAQERRGGDVKVLRIGETADRMGVSWRNDRLNVGSVPNELAQNAGRLTRHFAVVDSQRGRAIFGQGTFDYTQEQESQDEIYAAVPQGTKWNVRELRPQGDIPSRRYGSCASYVYDADAGLDGVIVLGGQQGGISSPMTYKEVWWLDLSGRPDGEWVEITDRFGNMDDFGYRRSGACAYNPATTTFYSWMGRADPSIPDGAERSAGTWRVDLTPLGTADGELTWERLAKDSLEGVNGRRMIPSVYDWANNRLFAIGGRSELNAFSDVWAIYPDVTGAECENLDPYAPFRAQPTETPEPPPAPDTPEPYPGPTGTAPPPSPTIDPGARVCSFVEGRVPAPAISAAVANPSNVSGYNQLLDPGKPESPNNPRRTWLSLHTISRPWHPLYNPLVYKIGCP